MSLQDQRVRPSPTPDRDEQVPAPCDIEPSPALRVVHSFAEPSREGGLGETPQLPDRSGVEVNDRRQVEIAGLYRQLRETEQRTEEFLAVVGHELRGPLAAIHDAVQIACLTGAGDPEHRAATNVIERQVLNMTRLVDDLLDVARIKHGKIQLQSERVDLKDVVNRALETSRFLIDSKNHHLNVSFPDQPVLVEGDLSRLAQVVSNLLANSAKYTEAGGRIELAVEAHGAEAILRVRDTGAGIAPAMLPLVFELYNQVPGGENRSEGGLGIGLSLVRHLIDLHGGGVQATSAGLGRGSEFVVRLPLLLRAPLPPGAWSERASYARGSHATHPDHRR